MTISALQSKMQAAEADLNARFRRRADPIRGLLVCLLARQHACLIGEPGEAKTALALALFAMFSDARRFHIGMHRGTTPEDLYGGPDLLALERGSYQRDKRGRLADCAFCVLDEPEKASEGVLNSMLVPLSDRSFEDAPIPLQQAIYCGNALPHELRGQTGGKSLPRRQGEDSMLPFLDRFAARYIVESVQPGSPDWGVIVWQSVGTRPASLSLTLDELQHARAEADAVEIPASVQQAVEDLAGALRTGVGKARSVVRVTNRTWCRVPALLRAFAWLDGRHVVRTRDLCFLADVLWTTPDQRAVILEAVAELGSTIERDCASVLDAATEALVSLREGRVERSDSAASGFVCIDDRSAVSRSRAIGATEAVLIWLDRETRTLQALRADDAEDVDCLARTLGYLADIRAQLVKLIVSRVA